MILLKMNDFIGFPGWNWAAVERFELRPRRPQSRHQVRVAAVDEGQWDKRPAGGAGVREGEAKM